MRLSLDRWISLILRKIVARPLERTISSLEEIGCTIDPDVATNACYKSALTELMRKRGYSVYLEGIHASRKTAKKRPSSKTLSAWRELVVEASSQRSRMEIQTFCLKRT